MTLDIFLYYTGTRDLTEPHSQGARASCVLRTALLEILQSSVKHWRKHDPLFSFFSVPHSSFLSSTPHRVHTKPQMPERETLLSIKTKGNCQFLQTDMPENGGDSGLGRHFPSPRIVFKTHYLNFLPHKVRVLVSATLQGCDKDN